MRSIVVRLCVLCLVALVCLVGGRDVYAAQASCETYDGSNVGWNDYETWSHPVTSYLEGLSDGSRMRVQGNALDEGYLVEYYTPAYELTSAQIIPVELPVFGGFYNDGTYYYILSGQVNKMESDSVEVFRVTKYDHSWRRLGSCGLFGANTYIPFDAGSARMVHKGKNLFIRTAHEMYVSSDGYHHQANVTIQVNTESMEVVDSFTGVMNIGYGYVSHSFNEFIGIDGDHLVAVDHGDAYPRSVVLAKYNEAYTDRGFAKDCSGYDLLEIDGRTGDNNTGVSVGGFEISKSHYLVAGNAVKMNGNADLYGTRNIFVVSADRKDPSNKKLTYLTSYGKDSESPSTPHLVTVEEDRYMILWNNPNERISYMLLDGMGNALTPEYTMKGYLSDCVPLVQNGRMIWYNWYNEMLDFYEINLSDLTDTEHTSIKNGHDYEYTYPAKGKNLVKCICKRCGKKNQFTTLTDFSIYWRLNADDGYYWSYVIPEAEVGDHLDLLYTRQYPEDAEDWSITIESSNPKVAKVSSADRCIDFVGKGTAEISFYPTYNPSCRQTYIFTCGVKPIYNAEFDLSYYSTTYNGKEKKPVPVVKYNGKTLTEGKQYTVSYLDNVNAGQAIVRIDGKGKYGGVGFLNFTIKKAANKIIAQDITVKKKKKAQKFMLEATAKGKAALSYSSDNSKIKVDENGQVTVSKNYTGSAKITIKSKATKNYKAAKKTITVTVKR